MKRITRLLSLISALAICSLALAAEKQDFSGYWLDCETYQGNTVFSGYVLMQKGSQICGAASSFATSRQYDGYVVGEANENTFIISKGCGEGTDAECPKLMPVKNRVLKLCDQKLYETGSRNTSCAEVKKTRTLRPYKKVKASKYERHLGKASFAICNNAL